MDSQPTHQMLCQRCNRERAIENERYCQQCWNVLLHIIAQGNREAQSPANREIGQMIRTARTVRDTRRRRRL